MKSFEGRWQLYESNGYDEFLAAMGVSTPIREALKNVQPKIEVTTDTLQRITFRTITPIKTVDVTFKVDEEFEELLVDGTKLRGRVEKNGDKLVSMTCSADGTVQMRVTRELLGADLVLTLEAISKNIKATRKYKRV